MRRIAGLAVTALLCACSSGSDAGAPRDGSGGSTTGGAQDPFVCNPHCDAEDSTSTESCAKLCSSKNFVFQTTAGEILGGLCHP